MKRPNIYFVIALSIISFVVASLGYSADPVPAAFAAVLLGVVLVLGMAAGQHDSRSEIERLQRIEEGRRVQANCMINTRNRLEHELEQLRLQQACVIDVDMGEPHAA